MRIQYEDHVFFILYSFLFIAIVQNVSRFFREEFSSSVGESDEQSGPVFVEFRASFRRNLPISFSHRLFLCSCWSLPLSLLLHEALPNFSSGTSLLIFVIEELPWGQPLSVDERSELRPCVSKHKLNLLLFGATSALVKAASKATPEITAETPRVGVCPCLSKMTDTEP
ncbi:hypothetical protein Y032_0008g285 [Ancylostoma ceylanicum]|uniref:Uncharacterized protein n=1 Tax=Ancylostoma ceylanicum TaxID=53326 RepID=A0A016VLW9_9BILA|nr:hypothetical protein Y032_0008g285 [Ancylostoma ceylanicum]